MFAHPTQVFPRAILAFALLGTLLVIGGLAAVPPPHADAQRATGGSGRYQTIEWFSWGTSAIPNGSTRTQTYTIAGSTIAVTCTISGLSGGGLSAYRPGNFLGDGLDDLYNIGGTGGANQLIIGLKNSNLNTTVSFNFDCSATRDGQPWNLGGLVMADAEASGGTEYIAATIPTTATWRIIDRIRNPACTQDSFAQRTVSGATQRLLVRGSDPNTCEVSASTSPIPAVVAFAEGTSSATGVTVSGYASALALGVMVDFDLGDAPASYGQAAAGFNYSFTGGEVPLWDGVSRGVTLFNGFTLASSGTPRASLGATVDSEVSNALGVNANGDDLTGSATSGGPNDENAVTPPSLIVARPGAQYTLPAVQCRGTSPVVGWIDFDLNGTFDADELSDTVNCNNTSVALTWTVPADAVGRTGTQTSYMRLRTFPAGTTVSPTGLTGEGEVEDYRIALTLPPQLTVIKQVEGRAAPGDQFTVTQTGPGLPAGGVSASTSGTQTTASTATQVVQTGATYTLTDTMAAGSPNPLSDYVPTVRCVETASGAVVPTTAAGTGSWTVTGLQNGQDVRCTITNTPRAASIDVVKTAGTSTGPNAAGQYTATYQVRVTNTGAVAGTYGQLTDTPSFAPNLVVDSAAWTVAGNGAPAGGQATGAGPFALAPAGTTIARDTTHTYNLTVTYHYTNRTNAVACSGPNTGLYNAVSLPAGQEASAATDNQACMASAPAPQPSMTVTKSASAVQDLDGNGPDVGDRIDYSFLASNTGNVTTTGLTVSDPMVPVISCPSTTIAPGGSVTCTGSYTLTLADVERGSVTNTATVGGRDPQGAAVQSPAGGVTTTFEATASMLLDKTAAAPADANSSGRTDAGDTIRYDFRVTNNGSVTLTNIAVADPLLTAITCAATALAPGASTTCTANPYTITQADMDAGSVNNSATVSANRPGGAQVQSPADTTSTALTLQSSMSLQKSAAAPVDVNNSGITDAGDTIRYSFSVTNTGSVTLSDVAINDAKLTAAGITTTCAPTTLAPDATAACTTSGPYTVTADDVAAGSVTNTATASATTPSGAAATSPGSSTSTPVTAPQPNLTVDKQAGAPVDVNSSGLTDAGDTIAYTFTVTNTGNVPLADVTVNDPKLAAAGITVNCPAGRLAVGATATCTTSGPYVITSADVASGAVTNSASASAVDPDGNGLTRAAPDTTSVSTTTPEPGLSLDKQAGAPVDVNSSGITDAGDTIAYTFTVTNTGNVPISQVQVNDPKLAAANITIDCPAGSLAPGATRTCTASSPYAITQNDVASGSASNTATAAGVDPDGVEIGSAGDTTSTATTAPTPSLSVDKQAAAPVDVNNSGITDAGDTIAYSFSVTNTGNVPVSAISINDAKLANAGLTITCPSGPLSSGATVNCTVSGPYTVTEADEQAGSAANTATATGTNPDGGSITSPPDSTNTPATIPEAAMMVEKRASEVNDVDGNGNDIGDTIAYSFVITNTGNVPLSNLVVNDAKLAAAGIGVTCPAGPLAAGASATCNANQPYALTAADLDSGAAANSATVGATDPDGGEITSSSGSNAVRLNQVPGVAVVKAASTPEDLNGSGLVDAGDQITYSFRVENAGNVTLSNVVVQDEMLTAAGISVTCPTDTLASGAFMTCSADQPYTVTNADVAAGAAANTATVTAQAPDGTAVTSPQSDTTTPTTLPQPALQVLKQAGAPVDVNSSGITDAGDQVSYAFTVTNTGNVPITRVEINDPTLAAAGVFVNCPAGPLAPGANTTCTTTDPYTVTAQDVADGAVANTATATGLDPDGGGVTSPPDDTDVATTQPQPGLVVDKQAAAPVDVNSSGITDAGDTIVYTFSVTNTGNVPVTGPVVNDAKLTAQNITTTCPNSVAPGATVTCTSSAPYTVTAADVAAGAVNNSANVVATDPDGRQTQSPNDTTSTPTTRPAPAMVMEKTAGTPTDVNNSGLTDAGDTIDYTFTVTNTGNVPLNDIAINDPKLAAAGLNVTCAATTVAPGSSTQCTTDTPYVVTQDDVASGGVTNSASATASDPDGGSLESPIATSGSTPTTQPLPGLDMEKQAAAPTDVNSSGLTDAGDTIAYTFTVTNTGNVPLRQVAIRDQKLTDAGLTINCPTAPLAVGAQVTCTTSDVYTIAAVDMENGSVVNSATGVALDPDGREVVSPADDTNTGTIRPRPSLAVEKQAAPPVDVNDSAITDAGDTIAYTFVVTNDGNVPMRQIAITDPLLTDAGITITCPAGGVAPGEQITCQTDSPYVVTTADEQAAAVTNTASATGLNPDNQSVQSPESTTTTPVLVPNPAFTMTKTTSRPADVDGDGRISAGDVMTFNFTLNNLGNVNLTEVVINDSMLSEVACPATRMAPQTTMTCTGQYTLTQNDVNAGAVSNTASATARTPQGAQLTTEPSTAATSTEPQATLAMTKTARHIDTDADGRGDAGEEIEYRFAVTNSGTVPLTEVGVDDPTLAARGIAVTCPQSTLAPKESMTCTAPNYRITQADIDAGSVTNSASARGAGPGGGASTGGGSTATTDMRQQAALSLTKSANLADQDGDALADRGEVINYSFGVTNTGNVEVSEIVVNDPMLAARNIAPSCAQTVLAPDATMTCTAAMPVTEADQGKERIVNVASVAGRGVAGNAVASGESQAVIGGDAAPAPSPSPSPSSSPSPSPTRTPKPTPLPSPPKTPTLEPSSSITPEPPGETERPYPGNNRGNLPNTGGPSVSLVAGGLLVLVVGLLLIFFTRRRKVL